MKARAHNSPAKGMRGTPNGHSESESEHVRKLLERYKVEVVDIESITPSPENDTIYGKINLDEDPTLRQLIASIERIGLEEPIICTADKFILSGHRRFFALQQLDWKVVPVRFVKFTRADSADYHRLLAQYNPQRVKSVAAILSEQFIADCGQETYVALNDRHFRKTTITADFMTVKGSKVVAPPGPRQQEFVASAVKVINDLEQFWPVSIRQVHYKLLNAPPLTQTTRTPNERWRYRNDLASYSKLSDLLVAARYHGHILFDCIDDTTRDSKEYSGFESVTEFVHQVVGMFLKGFHRNLQEGQSVHVEVLIEKNTLVNIVEPVCERFNVPYTVARGYGNPSVWRKVEQRWRDAGEKPLVLLCISDHDPEGLNLADDAVRSLRDLHGVSDLRAVRVGISREQVDECGLHPNMAKESSSRWKEYVRRTGTKESWEVEALEPAYLQKALHDALLGVLDCDQINAVRERQAEEIRQLAGIRSRLGKGIHQLLIDEGGL